MWSCLFVKNTTKIKIIAGQRIFVMNCMNYDHNKKFRLFKFQSGYRKLYFNSPRAIVEKIINVQTAITESFMHNIFYNSFIANLYSIKTKQNQGLFVYFLFQLKCLCLDWIHSKFYCFKYDDYFSTFWSKLIPIAEIIFASILCDLHYLDVLVFIKLRS